MSSRSVSRNNIVAGAFLLSAIVLGVATSVIISDSLEYLKPMTRHTIRFTLEQGAAGIKPGSAVTLGGQKVGRVTGIEFVGGERNPNIHVGIKVERSVRLYMGAIVNLERPLLGSVSEINITNVGDRRAGPLVGVVDGSLGLPVFLAQAGYGPEERLQVQGVIDDIERTVKRLSDAVARVEPQIDPIVASVRGAVDDVNAITRDGRERFPGWADRIDRTLASTETAAADLPAITADAKAGLGEARGVVASAQKVIDDNSPGVNDIVKNVRSATEKFDRVTIERVNTAAAEASDTLAAIAGFLSDASRKLEEQWPSVSKTLANFRLSSDQLKLLAVELRESPWRIFYQPKLKELESENLLVAARTYAAAVSDLRAASETLEAAAGRGNAIDPAALHAMTQSVRTAFEHYQRAERSLLDRLAAQEPAR